MTELSQPQQAQLELLDEYGKRFMEMKSYFLQLGLHNNPAAQENVRISIQYLDDSYMRGREAIMATEIVSDEAANDSKSQPDAPLAANN